MPADILARAKRRRLATLSALAARVRNDMRILGDAAATRDPVLGTFGDDPKGRAFAATCARVRERNCDVAPQDRIAALRVRIAARQQVAPRNNLH